MNFFLASSLAPVNEHKRGERFDGAKSSGLIHTRPRPRSINVTCCTVLRRPTGSQETGISPSSLVLLMAPNISMMFCSKYIFIFCRRFEGFGADQGKRYYHERQQHSKHCWALLGQGCLRQALSLRLRLSRGSRRPTSRRGGG